FEIIAGQAEAQAQQRNVDRARAPLRPRGRAGIPALLQPPERAQAGAMIECKREQAARRRQARCGSEPLAHGASMVEHTPGIDNVERPQTVNVIRVEDRTAFGRPIGIAVEMKLPQPASAENAIYVVIEGMDARAKPARGQGE